MERRGAGVCRRLPACKNTCRRIHALALPHSTCSRLTACAPLRPLLANQAPDYVAAASFCCLQRLGRVATVRTRPKWTSLWRIWSKTSQALWKMTSCKPRRSCQGRQWACAVSRALRSWYSLACRLGWRFGTLDAIPSDPTEDHPLRHRHRPRLPRRPHHPLCHRPLRRRCHRHHRARRRRHLRLHTLRRRRRHPACHTRTLHPARRSSQGTFTRSRSSTRLSRRNMEAQRIVGAD